ncbi:MAG: hypothetical protein J2P40_12035 [Candidatus Dormibacteraeota bacterium]|nr:hypothetical protein [Candidatus Dormibacteraeota bacterium]MBO0704254.1 hypothetical protein [Candidatus Dormibacteraeota bacterium]MBO0761995.1 hypothetical protein [Candidatus Dormibacteraeota bacterium]
MSTAQEFEDRLRDGVARTWGQERAADPKVADALRTAAGQLAMIAELDLEPSDGGPAD